MRIAPVLALTLLATPALAQDTDGVTAMCLDATAPDALALCTCATDALREQLAPDDFALYERIGTLYLANQADGMGMGDAWDAALSETGASLSQTNPLGQAHSAAMQACAG